MLRATELFAGERSIKAGACFCIFAAFLRGRGSCETFSNLSLDELLGMLFFDSAIQTSRVTLLSHSEDFEVTHFAASDGVDSCLPAGWKFRPLQTSKYSTLRWFPRMCCGVRSGILTATAVPFSATITGGGHRRRCWRTSLFFDSRGCCRGGIGAQFPRWSTARWLVFDVL